MKKTVELLPVRWFKNDDESLWILKNKKEDIARIEFQNSTGGGTYYNASFFHSEEYGEDFDVESDTKDAKDFALQNAKEHIQDEFCAHVATLVNKENGQLYKILFPNS